MITIDSLLKWKGEFYTVEGVRGTYLIRTSRGCFWWTDPFIQENAYNKNMMSRAYNVRFVNESKVIVGTSAFSIKHVGRYIVGEFCGKPINGGIR